MPADAGCAAGSKPCAGLHALPGTSGRACAGPSTAGQTPAWVTKNTIALSSSGLSKSTLAFRFAKFRNNYRGN